MRQFFVILRGAPASGKTTISKKLRNFENKIAWLKVDNFKDFFADDSSNAMDFVNGSALATLQYLLENNFSVIMDGVFQETKIIDLALEIAKSKGIKTIVYQLKCSIPVLLERDKTRLGVKEGCRKQLSDEIIKEIFNKLENNFYPNAKILDTEKLTLDECVELINKDIC